MLSNFAKYCKNTPLENLCQQLIISVKQTYLLKNSNIERWNNALNTINTIKKESKTKLSYNKPYLEINLPLKGTNCKLIESALKEFIPWRKGPFKIGNLLLDSEWRCDLKWNRLKKHIQPLKDKIVLDVGCSNGYFTFKIAMDGAKLALGIEPFLLFNYQFKAIRSLVANYQNTFVLPLKLENMPATPIFDTVFYMGVLYHQKNHMPHLTKLKNIIKNNGELVLETLIIKNKDNGCLIPQGRYARMRNVFCIPSIKTLLSWLTKAGFNNVKLIDVTKTTSYEQRKTLWIGKNNASLGEFLNSCNCNLTVEGYPAPLRAILICKK